MKRLEALFEDLGNEDDEIVKLAVQALGERYPSASEAEIRTSSPHSSASFATRA